MAPVHQSLGLVAGTLSRFIVESLGGQADAYENDAKELFDGVNDCHIIPWHFCRALRFSTTGSFAVYGGRILAITISCYRIEP